MVQFALATLNHSLLHGLPTSMAGHLDAARDAGFDALAPDIFWLRALEAEGTSLKSLSGALAERGLGCTELAGLAIGSREETEEELEELLRYVRALQPDFVNTRFVRPPDPSVLGNLRRCVDAFADVDARIAFEFSRRTELKNLALAREFIETLKAPGVGLTLDTLHFCQAHDGPDWDALKGLPMAMLANVQLSDGVKFAWGSYGDETMNRRLFAGAGDFDLDPCQRNLREKAFDGPVIVEVLNSKLREGSLSNFAGKARTSTRAWWNR